MGHLNEAKGKIAARVGHRKPVSRNAECLTGRSAAKQVERAECQRAVNEIGSENVAKVRMAETLGEDSGRERLDLCAPQPVSLGECEFGAANAREAGSSFHATPPSAGRRTSSAIHGAGVRSTSQAQHSNPKASASSSLRGLNPS